MHRLSFSKESSFREKKSLEICGITWNKGHSSFSMDCLTHISYSGGKGLGCYFWKKNDNNY